ncbi:glycogen synthase isoform 1 [Coelomomyces lativittatus]|nr:glycogen synthase isoform 1 [Coelomomyces lativittatus]KAJ1504196.1 glycogen synthase isoform 1 [Coelomomyces lativittatus]KAJ1517461.1 glycogen synthase isoform 1 [Coelomomyces lativittatus]
MNDSFSSMNSQPLPWLFEIAWEVANKVGGIYTVLRTKSPVTVAEYGTQYVMVGPLNQHTAYLEVEQLEFSQLKCLALKDTLTCMQQQGVHFLFGRWLIESAPYVLLFDLHSMQHRFQEWKQDFQGQCQIQVHEQDEESKKAIVFGYLVSWFLGEFVHRSALSTLCIAHFHEWLAGVALPLLKKRKIRIATIFTTHATLLGRYLCAGSVDFYNRLDQFDVDFEAGQRGIYPRYCIERAAAHSAEVFTTVSQITAYEAEHLLKRKPDGVVPNGLNLVRFAAVHEFQNLHALAKEKIHDFVRGHFYGHYDFDMDETLYFFIAGRNEFRNKGVDLFLEALARLNAYLKSTHSKKTIVTFIIMPTQHHSFTVESLQGHAVIKQLKESVAEIQREIGKRIFEMAARGQLPTSTHVLLPSELVTLKRRIFALHRPTLPPVVTHNVVNDAQDPILNAIRRLHLFNHPQDRVKLIYHPEFLNSTHPLLALDYDEFVRGCHLGVFPSYYEPWGYTPAECTVMGVPSITTNLSGFGCYMQGILETPEDYGIFVIDRRLKSVEESVQQLCDQLIVFTEKSRRQRIHLRNRTERLSDILDWKRMGVEYFKARHLALKRTFPASLLHPVFMAQERLPFWNEFKQFTPSILRIPKPFSAPGSPKVKNLDLYDDEELGEQVIQKLDQLGLGYNEEEEDLETKDTKTKKKTKNDSQEEEEEESSWKHKEEMGRMKEAHGKGA